MTEREAGLLRELEAVTRVLLTRWDGLHHCVRCDLAELSVRYEPECVAVRILRRLDDLRASLASGCSVCGAEEVEVVTPLTVYACGGRDYDRRPGTIRCPATGVER